MACSMAAARSLPAFFVSVTAVSLAVRRAGIGELGHFPNGLMEELVLVGNSVTDILTDIEHENHITPVV